MAASAHSSSLSDTVLFEAAYWYACLQADTATADDHNQWSTWLEACPTHQQAWFRIQEVLCRLNDMPPHIAMHVLNRRHPHARTSRRRKPPRPAP
ncbi:DUF4880 domain-containing protein [Allopusillimonas ginsengisoli]|nr:DUF4880 domain-containing protein [Allopusillimonas ginsengisoli]